MRPNFIHAAVNPAASRYAFFDSKPDSVSAALGRLVLCGFEETLPSYQLQREGFPCYALEFVVAGRGRLQLQGQSYQLLAGSAFAYGPNIAHEITSDAKKPLEKYFINLQFEGAEFANGAAPFPVGTCRQELPTHRIGALIEGMIEDEVLNRPNPAIQRASLELIFQLLQANELCEHGPRGVAYESYQKVRRYFEQHYTQAGTVTEFAQQLNLDSAYLTRLFGRFASESPHRFLTRLRLNRASQLLLHHDLQIQEVAQAVGYADAFNFSTRFKAYYGSSPRAFKRKFQPEP